MLAPRDTVLVAVSGGADSTALLHVLAALAPALDLTLRVLHVDHGLRPDSRQDAEAVLALGRRYGVPVDVERVDVGGGSVEAAARRARHAALGARAEGVGATRIALGHTADDQAETVLMRLLEGTGLRGLAGIPPVRGRLIRPLLSVRHRDLVAMLVEAGVPWIEDPTNRDPRYFRNRVRHEILPRLRATTGVDPVPTLVGLAQDARLLLEAVERAAADTLARHGARRAGALALPRSVLRALPAEVAVEALRRAACELGLRFPLRAWAHRGLRRLLASPPPCRPCRLGPVRLEANGDWIRIATAAPPVLAERALPVPGRVELPEIGAVLEARLVAAAGYALPREPARVAFDAGRLPASLGIRARRRGDRFRPYGAPGARGLKRFLIDAKVPRWDRGGLPLVTADDEIVWVAGLRRGAAAAITQETRDVLELALENLADEGARRVE